MDLSELWHSFITEEREAAIRNILRKRKNPPQFSFTGLSGSSSSMALAAVSSLAGKRLTVIVGDSKDDAGYLFHDISRILGDNGILFFPSAYKRSIKYGQIDPASQVARTEALAGLKQGSARVLITYPDALAEGVVRIEQLDKSTLHLEVDGSADMIEIEKWLVENDFRKVDYVYEPGQFAVRGSLLDIFSYSNELPFRVDFFGDDVDSIRTFNVDTQLSEQTLKEVNITANLDRSEGNSSMISLLEFIPGDSVIAFRDIDYTLARISEIAGEEFSVNASIAGEGESSALDNRIDPGRFRKSLETFARLSFTAARNSGESSGNFDFDCSPQGLYHKNFELISSSFTSFLNDGYKIIILSDSAKQFERLKDIFADRGDNISFGCILPTLHEGFVDHTIKMCVFTDHQIFDRFHKYTVKSDRARAGKVAMSLKELQAISVGDYIVHIDHGIGRFGGLVRTSNGEHLQEMVKLIYQNDDVILVSIHSLHKLSKYRGKEGVPPKINKLGSGAWNRVKEKTKNRLKDIARDLIKLYAARKDEKGFSFSPDTYMQHELEASFIYEDTPDQLTATKQVKNDMESDRPMDRLICGDVGFGKTEIAIRAAFKAATDNKQTAVLVPTTVLAYQHYNTFRKRLADFPVRIEYLSRAKSPKQAKAILSDLAEGKIDIIIGTHKLIGNNVKFKDLGLLVIDEEQKFGVAVKEKLKQRKVNVDTLTMSATPIPRTLQFSLMGARDLSSIMTPPPNRYPIETIVGAMTDELVAEAVNFELSRNGQIFIINNRIEGLYDLQNMLKRIVPDARTLVAHGQMDPAQLEQSIIDFANHDYDILIATTIIESGIDMPNVNTMIVANAHRFGLSELHQLRGRVGRSNRKAFCYLFIPPEESLTPVARRRLQAIENFSDLGSGIHIAMQDLDIRGAGNLLGAEQSGFIADLGYETYQKILKEAVTELRNEEFSGVFTTEDEQLQNEFVSDCLIESDMELMLPPTYVPTESERIMLYQELDSIERDIDLESFRSRLQDRFGKIPDVAEELLRVPVLRRLARQLGIEKVNLKGGQMYVYFVGEENKAYYQSQMFGKILHYLQENPRRVRIRDIRGKRSFVISNVTSIEQALAIFRHILRMESV